MCIQYRKHVEWEGLFYVYSTVVQNAMPAKLVTDKAYLYFPLIPAMRWPIVGGGGRMSPQQVWVKFKIINRLKPETVLSLELVIVEPGALQVYSV